MIDDLDHNAWLLVLNTSLHHAVANQNLKLMLSGINILICSCQMRLGQTTVACKYTLCVVSQEIDNLG